MKYRIIQKFWDSGEPYFIVQQKRWYGWGKPSSKALLGKTSGYGYYKAFQTIQDSETAIQKAIEISEKTNQIVRRYEGL